MDWSALSCPAFGWDLCLGVVSIIVIDLVLAGDNAVVIALAVKSLPRQKRMAGVAFGAGFAVLLRIVLTFFAAQLLMISYVKLIGGLLIFWIAVKLLIQDVEAEESGKEATNIWNAIWIIVVADVTMSTDNVLALAGASKGNLFLLLFGLILSIPFVVFTSTLLARLMDKYPIIVYLGAAVLGKVAAEMIFTDPVVESIWKAPEAGLYVLYGIGAIAVIVVGRLYVRLKKAGRPAEEVLAFAVEKAAVPNPSQDG
jgi:YjbE family integral membrane protein